MTTTTPELLTSRQSLRQEELHGTESSASESMADRNRLVEDYLSLVHRLCWRFRGSGESVEDLVQVGSEGLLKAADKYDPSCGVKFISYAAPVIVGSIRNYLRDHGWAIKVPRRQQKQGLRVRQVVSGLSVALGRSPTIPEIAEATGFTEEEVYDAFELGRCGKPMSLDAEHERVTPRRQFQPAGLPRERRSRV